MDKIVSSVSSVPVSFNQTKGSVMHSFKRFVTIGLGMGVFISVSTGAFAQTATGTGAVASGQFATATGAGAQATKLMSTATGTGAVASGQFATATGAGAQATKLMSTATGRAASATGDRSTATGDRAEAKGTNTIANGSFARAHGTNAIAIGTDSTAFGDNSIVIGTGASVPSGVANAVQIGAGTNTTTKSVQIGSALAGGTRLDLNVTGVVRAGDGNTAAILDGRVDVKKALDVGGHTTTRGVTNTGTVQTDHLTVKGNSTIGSAGNSSEVFVQGMALNVNSVTTNINSATTNTKSVVANGNVTVRDNLTAQTLNARGAVNADLGTVRLGAFDQPNGLDGNGTRIANGNDLKKVQAAAATDATTKANAVQSNLNTLTTTVGNNATTAANATAQVQTNLETEVTRAKDAETALGVRIDRANTSIGNLTVGASANVHNNGTTGAQASVSTGTATTAAGQIANVVNTTTAAINSTNKRVYDVETKTQHISATTKTLGDGTVRQQTEVNSALIVNGGVDAQSAIIRGNSITLGDSRIDGNATVGTNLKVGSKINLDGNNGNILTSGVVLATGGVFVGPRADEHPALQVGGEASVNGDLTVGSSFAVTADGSVTSNGINNSNQKITNVAAGDVSETSKDVVVGSQLNATNVTVNNLSTTVTNNAASASSATAQVQTNLNAEVVRAKEAESALGGRITTETNTRVSEVARVDSRIDTTNTRVTTEVSRLDGRIDTTNSNLAQTNQAFANEVVERKAQDVEHSVSIQKNANAIAAESNRAQQAEAALSKETKQVGAMAMAAAAVAGAVPVGDKKTAVSAAVGGYSGHTAIALGVTHMVKPNVRTFGAFSKVSGGKTGVAVGASFSF